MVAVFRRFQASSVDICQRHRTSSFRLDFNFTLFPRVSDGIASNVVLNIGPQALFRLRKYCSLRSCSLHSNPATMLYRKVKRSTVRPCLLSNDVHIHPPSSIWETYPPSYFPQNEENDKRGNTKREMNTTSRVSHECRIARVHHDFSFPIQLNVTISLRTADQPEVFFLRRLMRFFSGAFLKTFESPQFFCCPLPYLLPPPLCPMIY